MFALYRFEPRTLPADDRRIFEGVTMSDAKKKQIKIKRLKSLLKGVVISWTAVRPGDETLSETNITHKNKVIGFKSLQLIKADKRILFDVPHRWKITLQAHFYNNSVDEFEMMPVSECTIEQINDECLGIAKEITNEPGFHYFKYIIEII